MTNIINNPNIYFLTLLGNLNRIDNVNNQINFLNINNIYNCKIFYNYKWPISIINKLKEYKNYLDGAFSCMSGHYAIMKNALYNNENYIIICEDDIILTQDFINLYNNLNNLDFYFDYINLYSTTHNLIKLNDYNVYDMHGDFFKVKGISMWRNACYIVNKNFMKKYCDYCDKNIAFADYIINDKNFNEQLEIYFTDINCKYSKHKYCNIKNIDTTI